MVITKFKLTPVNLNFSTKSFLLIILFLANFNLPLGRCKYIDMFPNANELGMDPGFDYTLMGK